MRTQQIGKSPFWILVFVLLIGCSANPTQPLTEGTQERPTDTFPSESTPSLTITRTLAVSPTFRSTDHSILAKIQTIKFSLNKPGAESLSQLASHGMRFTVKGIAAIDQKVAFLFGSFEGQGNSDIRSVLFRTEDQGRTWVEVIKPFTISEVNHVAFVQGGTGWATITWTSEGILGTTFWRSDDYGETWQEIPKINSGDKLVLGLKFTDTMNGQVKFLDILGNPSSDGLVIWVTSDGGYTWNESLRVLISAPKTPEEKIIAAYAEAEGGRYGSHWGNCEYSISTGCKAFGADGSEWTIQSDAEAKYYVVRSILADTIEGSIHRLPIMFRYENGEFISQ